MATPENTVSACLLGLVFTTSLAFAQSGRDFVYVVGSSTVYPFATVVAERFGRTTRFRTPKVESTGSGGGIRLFCHRVGGDYPDIVNSSRRITGSEMAVCRRNGVSDVVEVRIGYDGIIVANSRRAPRLSITREQLYMAIARWIPGERAGQFVENPYARWSEIDRSLPDQAIEIYGPPPTSGTRDAFVEIVLEAGCRQTAWIDDLKERDRSRFRSVCHTVREDGRYIEAGENDNLIVQKLRSNPDAFGIMGFSFLDQNSETIKGASIDGIQPTFETIAVGDYPISRPLHFYVKKAHVPVIAGLREFLAEFTAERTWGDDGYLSYRGLVPLPAGERADVASAVERLETLTVAKQ